MNTTRHTKDITLMFILPPKGTVVPPYIKLPDAFTSDELDQIEALTAARAVDDGVVIDSRDVTKMAPSTGRRTKIHWLEFNDDNIWIYRKVGAIAQNINAAHYRFDLSGCFEPFQLTRYEATVKGHYDWHQDYGAPVSRKLSITLQLSAADAYDGGDLEIMTTNKVLQAERARGMVIAFPAYQLHRVTPVERGERRSLVAWISGPVFR